MQRTSGGVEEAALRGEARAEVMVSWEGLIQREAEELRLAQVAGGLWSHEPS